jgi:hypothetical protein
VIFIVECRTDGGLFGNLSRIMPLEARMAIAANATLRQKSDARH